MNRPAVETGSGEQPVFAAGPQLQSNLSKIVAWFKAKPGKRIVMSGRAPCGGYHALEAPAVGIRQVLPYNRVIDHICHPGNAIDECGLDPVGGI
jgi:hypothetical protein